MVWVTCLSESSVRYLQLNPTVFCFQVSRKIFLFIYICIYTSLGFVLFGFSPFFFSMANCRIDIKLLPFAFNWLNTYHNRNHANIIFKSIPAIDVHSALSD